MEAQTSSESPPSVIRGQDSQLELGLHWLRGSVSHSVFRPLVKYLVLLFGNGERRQFGLWGYDASIRWSNGVLLNFHSTEARYPITNGRFALECPGSALEQMDFAALIGFCSYMRHKFLFRPSRLDVFLDDFSRTITPKRLYSAVYEEADNGDALRCDFTGFRTIHPETEGGYAGRQSDSVYFGRRGKNGSGKLLRIYDRGFLTDNESTAVRFELELTDKPANTIFGMILAAAEDAANDVATIGLPHACADAVLHIVAKTIAGCVDFIHRTGDKNLCRLLRYDWWQDILDRLRGTLHVARQVVRKTISRAKTYIENQVLGTLQMVRKAVEDQQFFPWLVDLLDGRNRMKDRHERAVKEYRANLEGCVS